LINPIFFSCESKGSNFIRQDGKVYFEEVPGIKRKVSGMRNSECGMREAKIP
jgi:hypothetical protein